MTLSSCECQTGREIELCEDVAGWRVGEKRLTEMLVRLRPWALLFALLVVVVLGLLSEGVAGSASEVLHETRALNLHVPQTPSARASHRSHVNYMAALLP